MRFFEKKQKKTNFICAIQKFFVILRPEMKKYLFAIGLTVLLTFVGALGTSVRAQEETPVKLAGTYGTEFWLGFLRVNGVNPADESLKITIFVVAEQKVDVIIKAQNNNSRTQTISIPEGGGVGKFEITKGSAKINTSHVYLNNNEEEKNVKKGVVVYAKDYETKFSCYALIEAGTGNGTLRDATLVLPEDVLGHEYFVQTYQTDTKTTGFVVVATEDNTKVVIHTPSEDIKTAKGQTDIEVTLAKSEVYLVQSLPPSDETSIDLSGTTVCSDKPIAVFTGNEAAKIGSGDTGGYSANHLFEQVIPPTMWGNKFYVGLAGNLLYNFVQVTASKDGTQVKYTRSGSTQTVTLNRGESLKNPIQLNETNKNVVIESSKPVMCYAFLGCGADNQEKATDPETGDIVTYNWGNPTNTLVVPWTHRAKEMSFHTSLLDNQTAKAKQHYYVQIITDKADDGKIVVDGVYLNSTDFKKFDGDGNMVYANYEILTEGYHHISTAGQGFTGFVHGMTSEARAYQYTLGFDPPKDLDSLFIENKEQVMSFHSYDYENLPYMDGKGWYQRQFIDFPQNKQRLDTAYVCDSTIVKLFGKLATINSDALVNWSIYKCDANGEKLPLNKPKAIKTEKDKEKIEYKFTFDPKDKTPYSYYAVDLEITKKHILCTEMKDYTDTLRTMIRVNREYNDTIWRIVCETDTIHFFKEVPAEQWVKGDGGNVETIFQYKDSPKDYSTTDPDLGILKFKKEDNTYTRWYKSISGCDSIVTLKIWGCDTVYTVLDTVACEEGLTNLKVVDDRGIIRFTYNKDGTRINGKDINGIKITTQADLLKELKANGKLEPYTLTFKHGVKAAQGSKACLEGTNPLIEKYKLNNKKFQGCPDTFVLNLTIMPRYVLNTTTDWCIKEETDTYSWSNADGTDIVTITAEEARKRAEASPDHNAHFGRVVKVYDPCPDCPKGGCVMEYDTLTLNVAEDKEITVHICQNESYEHNFGGKNNKKTYNGWDYSDKLYPNIAVDETVFVEVGKGATACSYNSRLILYVHEAYADVIDGNGDKLLDTEVPIYDTICISNDSYYPINETKRWHVESENVWSEFDQAWISPKEIPCNLSSLKDNDNKPFEYVDYLKTTTCEKCNDGVGCDSIVRLYLYVMDTIFVEKKDTMCTYEEFDYKFHNIFEKKDYHYYYYSEKYEGAKKTPYKIIPNDSINICDDEVEEKIFRDTLYGQTRLGCDSILYLKISLHEAVKVELDTFVCVPYPEGGTYHFVDGEDKDLKFGECPNDICDFSTLVTDVCGCQQGVLHHVHILPSYNKSDKPDTICQWLYETDPKFYTWKDHPRDDEPDRMIYMKNVDTDEGDWVWTNEIPDTIAGTYLLIDSLLTEDCIACEGHVCDSIWQLQLTIIPTYNDTLVKLLPDTAYFVWGDTLNGVIHDWIFFGGKDVKFPQGKTVGDYENVVYMDDVPNRDGYFTRNYNTRYNVGTHTDCDSLMTYHVRVGNVFYDTMYVPIQILFDGEEPYTYPWTIIDPNTGETKDTLINVMITNAGDTVLYHAVYETVGFGFDSIYTIAFVGFPKYYDREDIHGNVDLCQGSKFMWKGGKDKDTPHPLQRDSVFLRLKDGPTKVINKDTLSETTITQQYGTFVILDSMKVKRVFHNPNYKSDHGQQEYEDVWCDSIVWDSLYIHPTYNYRYNRYPEKDIRVSLCSNEAVMLNTEPRRLFVGYDFDLAAHPIEKPSPETDYDSIVYIPPKARELLLFHDSIKTPNGTINYECDSSTYYNIIIHPSDSNKIGHHIGDNDSIWSFGGNEAKGSSLPLVKRDSLVPSSSVQYDDPDRHEIKKFMLIDTLKTPDGCDSIVWDTVYIHPTYRFVEQKLICSNEEWSWRPESPHAKDFVNINYKGTGIYYDSLKTVIDSYGYQFDSVYVLELDVEPLKHYTYYRNLCKNDTIYNWEGQFDKIYFKPQTDNPPTDSIEVSYTHYSSAQCDSVVTLKVHFYDYWHYNLETLKQVEGFSSDSICRFDTIVWISPNETIPHIKGLRGEKGEHFTSVPTDTLGWITVYDSLVSTAPCKCDSIYALRYFVRPSYRFYDTLTMCSNDTVYWRGQKLFTDSAKIMHPSDTLKTCGGDCDCDSIFLLTLYVNQSYDSIAYDTICGNQKSYTWQGEDIAAWLKYRLEDLQDTLPVDTFLYRRYDTKYHKYATEEPCDSVFQLHLNVRPIITEEWYDTICIGETFALNEKRFTETGIYTDTLLTIPFGCDSIAKVHLSVVPPTNFLIEPAGVCADKGGYDMIFSFDTLVGYPPREVHVVYDSLAREWGFPADTVTLPVVGNTVEMPMPSSSNIYAHPDFYSASVLFDNGTCLDLEKQKAEFHFTVNYPEWIIEQRWSDAIAILAEEYNGGYEFSAYQWYKNGEELVGETKPYYFAPDHLEVGAEYSVELTRVGDTLGILSCAITAVQRENTLAPKKPYVSVVPTYVLKENPVVHILCSQYGGDFKVYNPYGSLIQVGKFTPGEHNSYEVRLPAMSGIYMFELIQENGEQRTVKVVVN